MLKALANDAIETMKITILFIVLAFVAGTFFFTFNQASENLGLSEESKETMQENERSFWKSFNIIYWTAGILGTITTGFLIYVGIREIIDKYDNYL